MVVLLAHGIHGGEAHDGGIVVAGAVVVPVQAVHHVELLAVVLVGLGAGVGALTVKVAEGEVVVHLLDGTRGVHHHAVVALVILQVVMIYRRGAVEGDVAVIYQNLLQGVVFVYHIAAIVYCIARTAISHVELPACRIVSVADGAARGECDILRQI